MWYRYNNNYTVLQENIYRKKRKEKRTIYRCIIIIIKIKLNKI